MDNAFRPRILLNAAPLCNVLSGVARYTRSLYEAILVQRLADVSFFCNGSLHEKMPEQVGPSAAGRLPWWMRDVLREVRFSYLQSRLVKLAKSGEADLYHETGIFPLLGNADIPTVMTLYDLSLVKFSQYHPVDRVKMFERHFYDRIDWVDHYITISEFVRQEVIEILGIPEQRVTAIPLGVDKRFNPPGHDAVQQFRQRLGLPESYLLSVGTHEPRKNLSTLMRALSLTTEDHVLVSVGWKGWMNDEFHRELRRLNMQNRVIWLGHVTEQDLVLLYGGASLMVYPSLYEGFGLPILEAMACGCPVLCSNVSSMPEVAGDAALLVSPRDERALAESIDSVMEDDSLRARLRASGLHRAALFDWNVTAQRTIDVFRQVAG